MSHKKPKGPTSIISTRLLPKNTLLGIYGPTDRRPNRSKTNQTWLKWWPKATFFWSNQLDQTTVDRIRHCQTTKLDQRWPKMTKNNDKNWLLSIKLNICNQRRPNPKKNLPIMGHKKTKSDYTSVNRPPSRRKILLAANLPEKRSDQIISNQND